MRKQSSGINYLVYLSATFENYFCARDIISVIDCQTGFLPHYVDKLP
jgi:hypothetical protein